MNDITNEINLHESNCSNSLFQESWWLDAVAPNNWHEVISEHDGKIVGRLPYVINKNKGIVRIGQPPLTQTLGPWIQSKKGKPGNILGWEKDIMNDLIAKLPKFDSFEHNFNYSITNWLPFYWNGFSQSTKYTYVIEDLTDLDVIYSRFSDNIKSDIKKASKIVSIVNDLAVESFYETNARIYAFKGMAQPFEFELLKRIDIACGEDKKKIIAGKDSEGNILSAIYIVWDTNSAYYLLGGSDPNFRSSGANSLLLWEAIKFASGVTKRFDFEGSMIEPIERYFRGFGATQKPYLSISKTTLRYRTYTQLRKKLKI